MTCTPRNASVFRGVFLRRRPLLFAVLDLLVLLDQAKSTEEKMHDRRNRFLLREVSRTSDWAFPARSGFTTFCHRKVAPKVSAGHLCRDRTEVLTERAQKTALLRRKRLHRFDCGGSAKSASGLCTRLLPVVFTPAPSARTAVRSDSSSGAMRSLWCAPRNMIYSDVIPLYSI